jgi:translation initiation factor 2 beta subunit (eIF-2beta)/eIF-5
MDNLPVAHVPIVVPLGTKQTSIMNAAIICSPGTLVHFAKFIELELGTTSHVDGDVLTIKGIFNNKQITKVVLKYIHDLEH